MLTVTEYKSTPCARCGGQGSIPYFRHVKAGECFACRGTGLGVPVAIERPMTDLEVIDALAAKGFPIVHIETAPDLSDAAYLTSLFEADYDHEAFIAGARAMLEGIINLGQ